MTLGKFNTAGLALFNEYLDNLENNSETQFPKSLMFDAYYTVVDRKLELEEKPFATRWEAAKYLYYLLKNIENVDRDINLWAWLTAKYFDIVCPPDKHGERKLRERAAYIPEIFNYRRYYRHLLLGPYLIYKAHSDEPSRAMSFLCKPVNKITDVEGQLAASQEMITNKAVVQLATMLYYDPINKDTKPGAGGKGPGSPRRLKTVLDQFDLTYDLYAMSTEELDKLLPQEFDRFR